MRQTARGAFAECDEGRVNEVSTNVANAGLMHCIQHPQLRWPVVAAWRQNPLLIGLNISAVINLEVLIIGVWRGDITPGS